MWHKKKPIVLYSYNVHLCIIIIIIIIISIILLNCDICDNSMALE